MRPKKYFVGNHTVQSIIPKSSIKRKLNSKRTPLNVLSPKTTYTFFILKNQYCSLQQSEQPAAPRIAPQQPQFAPPPYYEPRKPQQDNAAEEAYWARRIEGLKRAHEKINVSMQSEYQKTLKEAHELFNMATQDKVANKLPPCQEEKAKVEIYFLPLRQC